MEERRFQIIEHYSGEGTFESPFVGKPDIPLRIFAGTVAEDKIDHVKAGGIIYLDCDGHVFSVLIRPGEENTEIARRITVELEDLKENLAEVDITDIKTAIEYSQMIQSVFLTELIAKELGL